MRIKWIVIVIALVLSWLVALYLRLSWGCSLSYDVECFSTAPGGGVVWSPCSYDGEIKIEPDIPLNWLEWAKFTCVAGGRVGNKTYVVFTREVGLIMLEDSPSHWKTPSGATA
ncbi:hypothetical protein [Pyrobaculum aerophilum]|uniref:Conserved within P. aerophilum part 1, authentic frameshift n=1 Tax=Pyrobaculum aerophilum (strain ATCC 51768 / DSM 7523 / JCM 9630 / CIP 104966 / NBRC 100827 / IM2) TaxID=178306 RepID=Q8ZTN1_PYRAE|nr:hypothetical protein [Pyrobaculum aerophilum]AAL64728.1 conserved within P. aerophilum part 1, authentic frameshift [Pyrobaculum aerophilum str. IM2]MCX8137600.1 hypothetical protein [Pyrobaculum aerophilum]